MGCGRGEQADFAGQPFRSASPEITITRLESLPCKSQFIRINYHIINMLQYLNPSILGKVVN